ncbi:MAG: DUF4097 family beta strand repeat-containing protein [Rhodanobacteraceae bacterium]
MRRLVCLSLIALLPAISIASECRYTAERNFDIDAAGLRTLAFELGSSDVIVEGVPGLARIEVRGRACASDEAWLDQLTVDQKRSGDRVEVTPHDGRDLYGSNWFGSSYAYVDLRVRAPTQLAVAIRSQSGDASAENVAALDFEGSSGDLEARHIAGVVGLKVSSGDVRATDIGRVDIRSVGSGDISLRDVHSDVEVGRSGSGDLQFDSTGSVRIGSVGSGDVSLTRANGDVSIDSIGSGDVNVNGVEGNLTVGSIGSGDVRHRNVRGKTSVPRDDNDDD